MLDLPHLLVPHGESTAPLLYMVAASVHADEPGLSHQHQQPWWRGDQHINTVNEFTWLIVPGPGRGKHHLDPQPGLAGDVLDQSHDGEKFAQLHLF